MGGASLVGAMKTLFSILLCLIFTTLAYELVLDGFSSCFDLNARWMQVVILDFFIKFVPLVAWVAYKESSWTKALVLMSFMCCFGSVVICIYIIVYFFKWSPDGPIKDPLLFVLGRHHKRAEFRHTQRPNVITSRVIYVALVCLMLGSMIFAFVVDGSPFRAEVLTQCMISTLIDTYVQLAVFSVWVAHKESSWITSFFVILSFLCFGSIAVCVYIARQLFYLSPQEYPSLVLFNGNKDIKYDDPLLMPPTCV